MSALLSVEEFLRLWSAFLFFIIPKNSTWHELHLPVVCHLLMQLKEKLGLMIADCDLILMNRAALRCFWFWPTFTETCRSVNRFSDWSSCPHTIKNYYLLLLTVTSWIFLLQISPYSKYSKLQRSKKQKWWTLIISSFMLTLYYVVEE